MHTNKQINSKGINTKPYNNKTKSETKLKNNLNFTQIKRGNDNYKTLINKLKQLNFNFNVKQN